jgi:hypothetical protein
LQFTIESRQLMPDCTRSASMTIEAASADDAISQFVHQSDSELMSFLSPGDGRESIGTVKKQDSVFLVRVYEA